MDDELIKLDRQAFFKQFLHPSLKELTNTDDFIDLEKSETSMPMLSDNQIVNIYKNVEEKDEEEKGEEELVHWKITAKKFIRFF